MTWFPLALQGSVGVPIGGAPPTSLGAELTPVVTAFFLPLGIAARARRGVLVLVLVLDGPRRRVDQPGHSARLIAVAPVRERFPRPGQRDIEVRAEDEREPHVRSRARLGDDVVRRRPLDRGADRRERAVVA